jgi:hypothetical protein
MGTVLMPVRRRDETRINTAMRAYGAVYKGAGINIMNLQLDFVDKDVLALCAGGIILMKPKSSNYIVAIYLIVIGAIGV